ncbi:MAG: S8 family peptidase [Pseudoxanthomonas sp.]
MIKKNKLGLAVAGAVLAISMGGPAAFAATPDPGKVVPVAQPAVNSDAGARLIVKYRDVGSSSAAKLTSVRSAASRAGVVQGRRGTMISTLGASHVRQLGLGADLIKLSRSLSDAEMKNLTREIAADASVEYVQVDRRMSRLSTPNDPFYATYQWHFNNAVGGINVPTAWDISTGTGAVVADLDTGILPAHPDMSANLLPGYDFITDAYISRRATDDRVPGALDYGDWTDGSQAEIDYCGDVGADDSSWHGTHTAGTIAEMTNNGIGMAGVAHTAKVLPVRVLGRCGGYTSDIADAIIWASGGTVAGVPANANPAEVINMSLGGGGACDTVTQTAINTAVANGTVVVVSAGNSNANVANYSPASCANVISVGASGIKGARAYYSNFGALVDIAAPGGGVNDGASSAENFVWQAGYTGLTTPTSGTYTYAGMAGTSMSAPHVSGVVALVQSALIAAAKDPLTPAAMETLLKETARPFPVTIPAGTPIGSGILDARAALDKALEEPCDPEVETCGPVATELTNKVNVTGLSGAADSEKLYSFDAAAGSVLTFMTLGGSGNVSLYVSFDEEPTTTVADFKSTRPGNSETVRITAPQAGTYYVKLVGATAYSGVTLVARQ